MAIENNQFWGCWERTLPQSSTGRPPLFNEASAPPPTIPTAAKEEKKNKNKKKQQIPTWDTKGEKGERGDRNGWKMDQSGRENEETNGWKMEQIFILS